MTKEKAQKIFIEEYTRCVLNERKLYFLDGEKTKAKEEAIEKVEEEE